MKTIWYFGIAFLLLLASSCSKEKSDMNIVLLHHSTGALIWNANASNITKAVYKINPGLNSKKKTYLPLLFARYNNKYQKNYRLDQIIFPKTSPYGWNNYPYDYYNIWVKNAGQEPFLEEPTLEILTKKYDVIIFKHCYPASNIMEDQDSADIDSELKTLPNYKLQYTSLREKLHEFSDTRFIVWTGAVNVKNNMTEAEATRAKEFKDWVTSEWDQPDDNIYIWDFYSLQTEGGLYFPDNYAVSPNDSHPNKDFSSKVAPLLFNRVIDVIENNGQNTTLTGKSIEY